MRHLLLFAARINLFKGFGAVLKVLKKLFIFGGLAWYANPGNSVAQQLVIDVYRNRVIDKDTNTMEMLNYIKVMTEARQAQLNTAKEG